MKKVLATAVGLLVVGALGALGFWYWFDARLGQFAAQPFGDPVVKVVEIAPGTNPKVLSAQLAKAGVVSDPELLYGYLRREKLGPKLKAGEYEFAGALTPAQVIEKIAAGLVKQYHFTVPEGLRVDEILPIIAASELHLSSEKLQKLAVSADFSKKLGVPLGLEGFLYPDTYSFPRATNEEMVLTKMVTRSVDELKKAPRKAGVELTALQAMTLASIVEKETGAPAERPRISCVFHNRLRLGMKLQTDPTVIYAMMLIRGRYIKNITHKDLETEHPYNTYTTKGLPPGPIANPGAAAIYAALNPIVCNDLFFVSRNDGTHIFCPDLKCHESNVQKYQVEPFKKKN